MLRGLKWTRRQPNADECDKPNEAAQMPDLSAPPAAAPAAMPAATSAKEEEDSRARAAALIRSSSAATLARIRAGTPNAAAAAAAVDHPGTSSAAAASGLGSSSLSWLLGDSFSSVARARGEGRLDAIPVDQQKNTLDEKEEANASPTASEVTATETESSVACDDECPGEDALFMDTAWHAAIKQLERETSFEGRSQSGMSSSRSSNVSISSDGSQRRRKKKPPMGLPPTSMQSDGLPMQTASRRSSREDTLTLSRQSIREGRNSHDLQSGTTAPVCATLSGAAFARSGKDVHAHAFDAQRRADWVESSGLDI